MCYFLPVTIVRADRPPSSHADAAAGRPAASQDLEPASELFKALGSPVRLALLTELDQSGPLCVHELVSRLGSPQPLVSHHLRILRETDVVRSVRRGKEVEYAIADAHVAHIVADAIRHAAERTAAMPAPRSHPPGGGR
jgi:ArsR family transcriptional regulator, zinc-responsive transcriptional repressor